MKDLVDQPIDVYKKPVWAIVSLVTGLIGLFIFVFFSYQVVANLLSGTIRADESLEVYQLRNHLITGGLSLTVLYLISLWCLIVALSLIHI